MGPGWPMPPRWRASISPSSAIIPNLNRWACAACAWSKSAAPMLDRASGQVVMENGQPKIQFMPKLETACTNRVSDGMVVMTATDKAAARPKRDG